MPVDTADKRASVTNLFTPLPQANSTVGAGDRAQVSWVYRGFQTAEGPPPPPSAFVFDPIAYALHGIISYR